MNIKYKYNWKKAAAASFCALMLASQSASGWSDGPAFAQRAAQNILTAAQWAKEIAHYATVVQNWKANLQNFVRDKISQITGINLSEKFSEAYMKTLLEKRKSRCSSITYSVSQQLCREMIDEEVKRLELFFESEKKMSTKLAEVQAAVNVYNRMAGSGGYDAGKLETQQQDIAKKFQELETIKSQYEIQVKIIEEKIAFRQKARVQIAQEQMKGTGIASTAGKVATSYYLQKRADSAREKAEYLRNQSNNRSNAAFNRMQ